MHRNSIVSFFVVCKHVSRKTIAIETAARGAKGKWRGVCFDGPDGCVHQSPAARHPPQGAGFPPANKNVFLGGASGERIHFLLKEASIKRHLAWLVSQPMRC